MSTFPNREPKVRILAALANVESEMVSLCADLIRIPSPNPPGNTTQIAAFVRDYLASHQIETETVAPNPERPNLLAVVSSGSKSGKRLMLNAHLDIFPADAAGWTYDPFSGRVESGRIYGRGACDMRAGLSVTLMLARIVRELDLDLPGKLTATFSSDEEAGGTWGTRWLLDHEPKFIADACLIGDQCGPWSIGVGEKGGCWIRIRTSGTGSHAAYGTAWSATAKMVRVLAVVDELGQMTGSTPPIVAKMVERQRPLVASVWGDQAPAILDRVTANIGTLSGGTSINLVADQCVAELDIRIPIGLAVGDVLAFLQARLVERQLPGVGIEVITSFEPTWTNPNDPLVVAVLNNSRDVRGESSVPVVRLGATDARWFRAAGIPTVVYGPTAHNMGGVDEYVSVDEMLEVARVHAGVIVDYLTGG